MDRLLRAPNPTYTLIPLLLLLMTAACGRPNPGTPAADYENLLDQAAQTGRKVLIVFGADWCPDCHALEAHLKTAPLRDFVQKNDLVQKVEVCRFDCNMDFAARFGHPEAEGIPALVIVDAQGKQLVATNNGEFASARSMSAQPILSFLERYTGDRAEIEN